MPVNDRPHYLRRVLDALREAKGHEDWTLIVSSEPGCLPVLDMLSNIDWMPVKISMNRFKRGIDVNNMLAPDLAVRLGSEFNLYLEDDSLVAKDALLMADWFSKTKESEEASIISLRRIEQDKFRPNVIGSSLDGLLGDGFAFNTKLWPRYLRAWWFYWDPRMTGFGWDWALSTMMERNGWKQYNPMVNRSQNIGMEGTNTHPGWRDPNHCTKCYDGEQTDFVYG